MPPSCPAFVQRLPDLWVAGQMLRARAVHFAKPQSPLPSCAPPTQRLEDIHALEVSKADKARWEQVPPREKQEKQVGLVWFGWWG